MATVDLVWVTVQMLGSKIKFQPERRKKDASHCKKSYSTCCYIKITKRSLFLIEWWSFCWF